MIMQMLSNKLDFYWFSGKNEKSSAFAVLREEDRPSAEKNEDVVYNNTALRWN